MRIATAGTVLMPLMPLTVLNVKINAMVLEEYKTAIPLEVNNKRKGWL